MSHISNGSFLIGRNPHDLGLGRGMVEWCSTRSDAPFNGGHIIHNFVFENFFRRNMRNANVDKQVGYNGFIFIHKNKVGYNFINNLNY